MSSILIVLWLLLLLVLVLFLIARYLKLQKQLVENGFEDVQVEAVAQTSAEESRPVAILLISAGLTLVWMGQTVYIKVPLPEQVFAFIITAVGCIAFFLGGHLAVKKRFSPWMKQLLQPPLSFFDISAVQFFMIILAFGFTGMARLAAGDGLLARHLPISVGAWLAAIILSFFGFYPLWQNGRYLFGRKVNITKSDWLVLAVLSIAALLLRAVSLAQYPNAFSGDEGSVALHAMHFLDGRANNLFTTGWFSFPSLYFAIIGGSIEVLGQTIEAVRLISALGGTLAVIGTYLMGRVMFDRATAVFAAGYLAASHYHIHLSRIALNNIWDSVFIAFVFAAFWYGWRHQERIGFVVAGLALGLGQYFYVTIRILPILLLLWALAAWWRKRDLFKQRFPGLVVTALLAFIVVLPLGLYFAGNLPEFNAPLNRVTIVGPRLAQMAETTGQSQLVVVLKQMMQAALGYTHEPLRLLYNPGSPLLLSGAAALFLLGILWGLLHFDLRYLLLFLPIFSVIITSGLSEDPPASQRFVMAMPIVALFLAIPIGLLFKWLRELWPKHAWVATAVTAVCLLWLALLDINYYFLDITDSFIYGGTNTIVATEVGLYLRDHEVQEQKVYFFGLPRMGYYSLSTIPYLAPSMAAEDVPEPLTAPPAWTILKPTLFIFLPERVEELEFVRQSYPNGQYNQFTSEKGEFVFASYEVLPPAE